MKDFITPNDSMCIDSSDSRSIQKAMSEAKRSGCNKVIIPRMNNRTGNPLWIIDKTVLLPSEIQVVLDNCHLRLADGIYENIFRNENLYTPRCTTREGEQHGIIISGAGTAILDGGLPNGLTEFTSMQDGFPHIRQNNLILLHNVRDYVIENLRCINQRWWAINQLFCRRGRLSNLDFYADASTPNQDGINVRAGCSEIFIENITGQTGDDMVAVTAIGDSPELWVESRPLDVHDVLIRNVFGTTRQTIVALRNNDGAKLYNITVENIADISNNDEAAVPWGAVRVGEGRWFVSRLSEMGETYNISVRNVTSMHGYTLALGGTIRDSYFSGIHGGGSSVSAVMTDICWNETFDIPGGVQMINCSFENIFYTSNNPEGIALNFQNMRPGDTMKNVVFKNIYVKKGLHAVALAESADIKLENLFSE